MKQLPHPDLVGCWPLGAILDPGGDNDEECGKTFEDPTSNLDTEEEEEED